MHILFSISGACFSCINPLSIKNSRLVAHSQSSLSLLGLPPSEAMRPELVEYFSGSKLLPGSEPAAHCYCGHQFGHFSGHAAGRRLCYVRASTH